MALVLNTFVILFVSVSLGEATGKSSGITLRINGTQRTDNTISSTGPIPSPLDNSTGDGVDPTQTPDKGLTTLAFGVMSLILILIIVMVILLTAVNLRGRCGNTKEEGVKSYGSVVSEGNLSNIGQRESIMLVSMKTLYTDIDTDSPRISSIYTTALDNEDQ